MPLKQKWEKAQKSYAKKVLQKNSLLTQNLENLIVISDLFKDYSFCGEGKSVLDVACGPGYIGGQICEDVGYFYLDKRQNLYGCDLLENNVFPGEFKKCSAENIDFSNDFFDGVTCVLSLDHFLNPHKVFQEIYRILKRDGEFFLAIQIKHDKKKSVCSTHPHHIHSFSVENIKTLFERTGFQNLDSTLVQFDDYENNVYFFKAMKTKKSLRKHEPILDKAGLREKPIDVLFLAWDDNCNTMWRFWQCAVSLGLNSIMFKGRDHPFGYKNQSPIHPSLANQPLQMSPTVVMAPGIETLLQSATLIHLGASTFPMAAFNWNEANVVVQHGGTAYRQNPEACNEAFNPIVDKTIIQCPDLLGLGAKEEKLIYYPVDTDLIQPDYSFVGGDKLVVGHFPSNPEVKGTETIEKVVAEVDKKYPGKIQYIGSRKIVPWHQNLIRLKQCDIVIECCNPLQRDKKYGEWGNTALEAAASGCVVITNCLSLETYEKEYGDLGIRIANDAEQLEDVLTSLIHNDGAPLQAEKRRSRKWAKINHSIPATAQRLWEKCYKFYF